MTDADTGLPIANIKLAAGPNGDSDLSHIFEDRTDVNGDYSLMGVPDGIIEIHSDDTQGYIGDMERTVTVGVSEAVTGFDYSLQSGGSISGTVTDVDTGLPITNIGVHADGGSNKGAESTTGDDGRYTLSGLPPGFYTVSARGEFKGYVREQYDERYIWEDADRGRVTGTEAVEGRDFGLKQGATISGTVTDAQTGLPIANMDVKATVAQGNDVSWDDTSKDGRYTLRGVPDGSIEVVVAGQGYIQTSQPVTILDGLDLTGVNF